MITRVHRGAARRTLLLLALLAPAVPGWAAADAPLLLAHGQWSFAGGEVQLQWNQDLAERLGLRLDMPGVHAPHAATVASPALGVSGTHALTIDARHGAIQRYQGGALHLAAAGQLRLPGGAPIALEQLRLAALPDRNDTLGILDASGAVLFELDAMMTTLDAARQRLSVVSSDLRISAALAARIGRPDVTGWVIASLGLETQAAQPGARVSVEAPVRHWDGEPAPDGGVYRTDLMMLENKVQFTRCNGCSGNAGNGEMVITPDAELKNNLNAGELLPTVPGDPLGVSTARWAASIPWRRMFSDDGGPYQNDQHPYLVWNMYRINAEGGLQQIGASWAKHAFFAINSNCLYPDEPAGFAVGPGCEDLYSAGTNDALWIMSPRNEILAHSGQWGRCGSVFDPDCTGRPTYPREDDQYQGRLRVNEQQVSPTIHRGARWLFETWYVARDDINPLNSMATQRVRPRWANNLWTFRSSGYALGPAIDRWVAPGSEHPTERNTRVHTGSGTAILAMKARQLPSGLWRYDYALMNIDAGTARLGGSGSNLRLHDHVGLRALSVEVAGTVDPGGIGFHDVDAQPDNDWTVSTAPGRLSWTARDDDAHGLGWGTLYAFSLHSPHGPGTGTVRVQGGGEQPHAVVTLVPGGAPVR
jgi:hypothetical protein